jgi:hypothetical protein
LLRKQVELIAVVQLKPVLFNNAIAAAGFELFEQFGGEVGKF